MLKNINCLGTIELDNDVRINCSIQWDENNGGIIELERGLPESIKYLPVMCSIEIFTIVNPEFKDIKYGAITTYSYEFSQIIEGVGYSGAEAICQPEYLLEIHKLEKWISAELLPLSFGEFSPEKYSDQFELPLISGTLNICRRIVDVQNSGDHRRIEQVWFRFNYPESKPLDEFLDEAEDVLNLFSFISGWKFEWTMVNWIIMHSGDDAIRGRLFRKREHSTTKSYDHIPYHMIKSDLPKLVRNWQSLPQNKKDLHKLLIGISANKVSFLAYFLAVVQFVEGYHRAMTDERLLEKDVFSEIRKKWSCIIDEYDLSPDVKNILKSKLAYQNEISLRTRLKNAVVLCNNRFKLGSNEIKLISDVRNYYTHYDPNSIKNGINWSQLYTSVRILWKLSQILALKDLGVNRDTLNLIADRIDRWG